MNIFTIESLNIVITLYSDPWAGRRLGQFFENKRTDIYKQIYEIEYLLNASEKFTPLKMVKILMKTTRKL